MKFLIMSSGSPCENASVQDATKYSFCRIMDLYRMRQTLILQKSII